MKVKILLLILLLCASGVFAQPAKNAVWIIGDGMGPGTMGLFMQGVRHADLERYPDKRSVLEKFINQAVTGMFFDSTYDTIVTDSACASTQMAGGELSRPDRIGVDYAAKPMQTIMEQALAQGKSVGVITDTYVADATPAGFLTHTISRQDRYNIARQFVYSGASVVMGGGLKYFTGAENKDLLKQAQKQGWTFVSTAEELTQVKEGRVLGLFSDDAMPFYGDMEQYPHTPTLLQMTQKAIELLSQNEKGFLLMVEAGKIDWALHDNEAGPTLWEMVNLDETLAYVWQFAQENGNTLVYVNADHETGVPVFHYRHLDQDTAAHKSAQGEMLYSGNMDYVVHRYYQHLFAHKHLLYYVYPEFKKLPKWQQTTKKLQSMIDQATGVHWDLKLNGTVPDYPTLIKKLNDAQGMTWATGNHSSGILLGVAYGPGAENFSGVYHNTELKKKFETALGF